MVPTSAAQSLLDIRLGMDVYSAYQDEYIGSVVRVWYEAERPDSAPERGSGPRQSGSSREAVEGNPETAHEEGAAGSPTYVTGRRQLGEEMGPFPTVAVGNTGPANQSASHEYATRPEGRQTSVRSFAVRPGRINLGPLTALLYVPTSAVRSVSMERIVLDVQRENIPPEWRRPPGG